MTFPFVGNRPGPDDAVDAARKALLAERRSQLQKRLQTQHLQTLRLSTCHQRMVAEWRRLARTTEQILNLIPRCSSFDELARLGQGIEEQGGSIRLLADHVERTGAELLDKFLEMPIGADPAVDALRPSPSYYIRKFATERC